MPPYNSKNMKNTIKVNISIFAFLIVLVHFYIVGVVLSLYFGTSIEFPLSKFGFDEICLILGFVCNLVLVFFCSKMLKKIKFVQHFLNYF